MLKFSADSVLWEQLFTAPKVERLFVCLFVCLFYWLIPCLVACFVTGACNHGPSVTGLAWGASGMLEGVRFAGCRCGLPNGKIRKRLQGPGQAMNAVNHLPHPFRPPPSSFSILATFSWCYGRGMDPRRRRIVLMGDGEFYPWYRTQGSCRVCNSPSPGRVY
jgi:hypothetical protein